MGKTIVKMLFGSHVYGCNTPTSDTDYKGVYIPDADDILLGRQPKTSVTLSTGQGMTKNSKDDVDDEMFTLQGFLRMVAEGQVVALDMVFTPDEFITESTPLWNEVRQFCLDHLLSKTTTAYVGYCRKQAGKYGIKGSRVGEVRGILDLLKTFDQNAKLFEYADALNEYCQGKEFTSIVEGAEVRNIGGGGVKNQYAALMLQCCERKATLTISVKAAVEMYQRLFDAYGERARKAETSEGVDWKAMHHAMRCCFEAIEFLDTHKISFPLPEKEYLLDIKKGKIAYPQVAEHLEELMVKVERSKESSNLPEQPQWKLMEQFIINHYKESIIND